MQSLDRKLPVRISIVAVNVLGFCAALYCMYVQPNIATQVGQLYFYFSGVCGTAIGCDMARPSGKVDSIFSKAS